MDRSAHFSKITAQLNFLHLHASKSASSMHGPAGRPHRDFRAPYCTLRRWQANTPPNLPRPPPPAPPTPAPAGERSSQTAPHSQTQTQKGPMNPIVSAAAATMTSARLQPLQLAVVSLQLPLQLLDKTFYAPTPTVWAFHIAAAPASPASEVEPHNSNT